MKIIQIETTKRDEMIDITRAVQDFVDFKDVSTGAVIVQSLHTTAGITVNENADPDVKTDFLEDSMKYSHGSISLICTLRGTQPHI